VEIRIRVKAIGLNRAETNFRAAISGPPPAFPAQLGLEASGEIDAIGSGVTGLRVGDAVSVIATFGYTQYGLYGDLVSCFRAVRRQASSQPVHLWRQRCANGSPEQITFGPTEEEGIAVAPDGRSLVTSAGIWHSSVWLHDAKGDRQISSEGFAALPSLAGSVFSPDGKKLFYLARKEGSRAFNSGELL
jgi:NADPH:quinone reductase-like Zn-dependent oxidoreductase